MFRESGISLTLGQGTAARAPLEGHLADAGIFGSLANPQPVPAGAASRAVGYVAVSGATAASAIAIADDDPCSTATASLEPDALALSDVGLPSPSCAPLHGGQCSSASNATCVAGLVRETQQSRAGAPPHAARAPPGLARYGAGASCALASGPCGGNSGGGGWGAAASCGIDLAMSGIGNHVDATYELLRGFARDNHTSVLHGGWDPARAAWDHSGGQNGSQAAAAAAMSAAYHRAAGSNDAVMQHAQAEALAAGADGADVAAAYHGALAAQWEAPTAHAHARLSTPAPSAVSSAAGGTAAKASSPSAGQRPRPAVGMKAEGDCDALGARGLQPGGQRRSSADNRLRSQCQGRRYVLHASALPQQLSADLRQLALREYRRCLSECAAELGGQYVSASRGKPAPAALPPAALQRAAAAAVAAVLHDPALSARAGRPAPPTVTGSSSGGHAAQPAARAGAACVVLAAPTGRAQLPAPGSSTQPAAGGAGACPASAFLPGVAGAVGAAAALLRGGTLTAGAVGCAAARAWQWAQSCGVACDAAAEQVVAVAGADPSSGIAMAACHPASDETKM